MQKQPLYKTGANLKIYFHHVLEKFQSKNRCFNYLIKGFKGDFI
jgi:hypothetical protein